MSWRWRADDEQVVLSASARAAMDASAKLVDGFLAADEPVYGVTTGFGSLATTSIPPERTAELQLALIRSHASGMGREVEREVVRAMVLLRARSLAMGCSGARPEVAEGLVAMLNAGLTPVVHEHGSLGASGDLAPLAEAALALIGEGELRDANGAAPVGDGGAGGRRPGPGDAPGEGGAGADQRHRRDPRHARAGPRRPAPAAAGGRHHGRHVGRSAPRHRSGLRRRPPGAPPPARSGGERGQPPAAPRRLGHRRQPPRRRPSGAGRLLAALHPAGTRSGPRHRRPRRARRRPRAGVGHRQPDDPAGRPGGVLRELPRRAAGLRVRLPGHRRGRCRRHRRAPHRPAARPHPVRTACRRSWRPTRASTPA